MEINEKVVKLRAREKELQTELNYWKNTHYMEKNH